MMPSANSPIVPTSITSTLPISPTAASSNKARRASLKVLNRNIDQIVLGNLLFRTWYYSPYPDSITLGEEHASNQAASSHAGLGSTTPKHFSHPQSHGGQYVNSKVNGVPQNAVDTNISLTPAAILKQHQASCPLLHVCPYCFRYTPKADSYAQHLRRHTVTYNPHSETESEADAQRASNDSAASTSMDDDEESEEDSSIWPVPRTAIKVYSHAGYTVWDVDGEREKLYCQNLSLFGKLFLEQKSVFFDTGGFHYFVLTYTPPPPLPASSSTTDTTSKRGTSSTRTYGRRRTLSNPTMDNRVSTTIPEDITLRTQVLGFFSKENLSWDANNLACILVFPPYQHRNLGQLLMAVSYKLSGWEWEDSIIGGPEKPLSAMGRRSYLRFWSERVARFMMGQTADADGRRVFDGVRRRKKVGSAREEMTVREVGERTGMLAEDVMAALNEMGILEAMPPKKKKRKSEGDEVPEEAVLSSMVVHRSRVMEWVASKGVELLSPVREEGFLGEWALSEVEDEEVEHEEGVEDSE